MPVKIENGIITTDPRIISKDEYEIGRKNFVDHYNLEGCDPEFGGQDITILWDDLNTAVNDFSTTYGVALSKVALRFVYCFNKSDNNLYYRLQLCRMIQSTTDPNVYDLDDSVCAWYKIENDTITTTQDTTMSNALYFNNLFYCPTGQCDPADATTEMALSYNPTMYARNITFPWENEVLEMYTQNNSPKDAFISFGATSYIHYTSQQTVPFPHGMVIYLRDSDMVPLLNNDQYIVAFHNKGCDMGSLCPAYCNVYIAPSY